MSEIPKWQFVDPVTTDTYTFEVNPNETDWVNHEKQIQYENTAAPDGKTLVFEGRDAPKQGSFSGVILSQAQYQAMITWFDRRHQVQVIDDLGRSQYIYIKSFKPKRVRAVHYPYKHTYTVDYTIVDWPS